LILDTLHEHIPRETIEVPIKRLDDYIKKRNLEKISLIKIDVEGFEFPVLKGLQKYFENTKYRPDIICEIQPSAYPLLDYTRDQFLEYMGGYGYEAYNIFAPRLKIDIAKFEKGDNVIFRAR